MQNCLAVLQTGLSYAPMSVNTVRSCTRLCTLYVPSYVSVFKTNFPYVSYFCHVYASLYPKLPRTRFLSTRFSLNPYYFWSPVWDPTSSYVVDVRFFLASIFNGSYLLCVHAGIYGKFYIAKEYRLCSMQTANVTFLYFFPFDPEPGGVRPPMERVRCVSQSCSWVTKIRYLLLVEAHSPMGPA